MKPFEIVLAFVDSYLQTIASLSWIFLMTLGGVFGAVLIVYVTVCTRYFWIALLYVGYVLGEGNIARRGGRQSMWVRRWTWWRYCRDYAKVKLVKTAELDPSRNYILCIFPHGLIPYSALVNFGTEANDASKLFPGITYYGATLDINFKMPITRDVFLSLGGISCSRESINHVLSGIPSGGRAVGLQVGGAAEALNMKPRTYHIVLKRRKGFIKLALKNGTSLVPVISFGENDLYDQMDNPKGSWVRSFQDLVLRITGVALVLFKGRYFILPKKGPIITVVGKPLEALHIPEPTDDEVNEVHRKFTEELIALFEEHKHHYVENAEKVFLEIE